MDKHPSLDEALAAFTEGLREAGEMPTAFLAGFAMAISCVMSEDDRDVAFAQGVMAYVAKRLTAAQN